MESLNNEFELEIELPASLLNYPKEIQDSVRKYLQQLNVSCTFFSNVTLSSEYVTFNNSGHTLFVLSLEVFIGDIV